MATKIINLSLPPELVELIDAQAKLMYATRSEYIKRAIIAQLKAEAALDKASAPQTPHEVRQRQLKQFIEEYTKGTYTEDVE